MKNVARNIAAAALVAVIMISGYFVLEMQKGYTAEKNIHQEMTPYKPAMPEETPAGAVVPENFVDSAIVELKAEYEDAVGWITIPHTGIDYPFVQVKDNRYYLDRDIDGNYSAAGTLFMDYLNSSDFSDFNTVIYGHHMKNGTMFGPLLKYNEKDFFNTNTSGTIFLENKTFDVEFFAYMIVQAEDHTVYESPAGRAERQKSLDYILENSRHYREIGVGPEDQIVTLSTCAYEFKDARMLLAGKLSEYQQ